MNQTNINLNLPSEWLENVQELALQNNQSVSELILEVLAKYLQIDYDDFQRKQIRKEIAELRAKFSQIEQTNEQFVKLNQRLNTLEKLIISLQSQVNYSQSNNNLVIIDEQEDEEIYDEPDEILTDFLP